MALRPSWFPDLRGPHLTARICYLHVPKCAGSSLVGAMRRKYRLDHHLRSHLTSISAEPSLAAARLLESDLVEYRKSLLAYFLSRDDLLFLTGHVGCTRPIVDRYAGHWNFLTVLRDPVARFMSEYFYNRYKDSPHFATRLSLEEYVGDASGRASAQTYLNLFSGLPRTAPDDERIEDALGNVTRFGLVGFVDELEDFRAGFARLFGVALERTRTNTNPAPEYDALRAESEALRDRIEVMCAGDIEFYRQLRQKLT